MKIDIDKCTGCSICEEVCPLGVIKIEGKKVQVQAGCVDCKTCQKVCPKDVFSFESGDERPMCTHCPIMCRIPAAASGACKRYLNEAGTIVRKGRVHTYTEVAHIVRAADSGTLGEPLLTGIGSGTTYPDFIPSPLHRHRRPGRDRHCYRRH